jgi:hypothetical protein
MIYSEIFETNKGKTSQEKMSICEVHQQIYDILVLNLQDRPELLKKLIPLLETVFSQGISIVHKLIEYKLTSTKLIKNNIPWNPEEAKVQRLERIQLVNLEKQLSEIKKSLGNKVNYC